MATKTIIIDCEKTNAIFAIRTDKENGTSIGLRFSKSEAHHNHVKIATAILGNGDKFSHKKGRKIVLDRFDEGACIVLHYSSLDAYESITSTKNLDYAFEAVKDFFANIE